MSHQVPQACHHDDHKITQELPEFQQGSFKKGETLGSGAEGTVYTVDHPMFGKIVVKEFFHPTRHINYKDRREIENMGKLTLHPNIIRFFGLLIDKEGSEKNIIGYAMEIMEGGSLADLIHDYATPYSVEQMFAWSRQAASALNWLHDKNVVHRDVKPSNMLLSKSNNELKLCDFGVARVMMQTMTTVRGTYYYMAPEVLNQYKDHDHYTNKCDVYSLGITMWEMAARQKPYDKMGVLDMANYVTSGHRPDLELVENVELLGYIQRCLSQNPVERPTMSFLVEALTRNIEPVVRSIRRSESVTVEQALNRQPYVAQPRTETVRAAPCLAAPSPPTSRPSVTAEQPKSQYHEHHEESARKPSRNEIPAPARTPSTPIQRQEQQEYLVDEASDEEDEEEEEEQEDVRHVGHDFGTMGLGMHNHLMNRPSLLHGHPNRAEQMVRDMMQSNQMMSHAMMSPRSPRLHSPGTLMASHFAEFDNFGMNLGMRGGNVVEQVEQRNCPDGSRTTTVRRQASNIGPGGVRMVQTQQTSTSMRSPQMDPFANGTFFNDPFFR